MHANDYEYSWLPCPRDADIVEWLTARLAEGWYPAPANERRALADGSLEILCFREPR